MTKTLIELWVGIFVLAGVVAIALLAFQADGTNVFATERNYKVHARFSNIGGLNLKAPVTIAGVTVGRVSGIAVSMDDFSAEVELSIARRYDSIPIDTSARILTAGLLGAQYIGLEQGGEDIYLADGDVLELTQSAFSFEDLIGGFLVRQGSPDQ